MFQKTKRQLFHCNSTFTFYHICTVPTHRIVFGESKNNFHLRARKDKNIFKITQITVKKKPTKKSIIQSQIIITYYSENRFETGPGGMCNSLPFLEILNTLFSKIFHEQYLYLLISNHHRTLNDLLYFVTGEEKETLKLVLSKQQLSF